ncbi:ribosomal RNA small subunit methyltransferase A [Candidatus Saccharibacteria bacterium]|nr:ribosomal RNA small subunit methyltransferase A [Candidatus Saccharibacteria bacterium]
MVLKNNKSLGQHWLKDREILDDIAACAASPQTRDSREAPDNVTALEIGPGLGTLTSSLLKHFDKVIAVEYDKRLADNLPKSFPGKNLEVINADFLAYDLNQVASPYVVAGNIPYYITSPIIMKLLETDNRPERIVLLIQKEVAERIAAEDGKESVLSLSVKNRAFVELGPVVPKEFFTPPPKVDSQIIILEPHQPLVSDSVIKLIKLGFTSPRKKLSHNLNYEREKLLKVYDELGISHDARPADLSLEAWQDLAVKLAA